MLSSILRGLATGYLRVDGGLERLRHAALGVAGGFFSAALSPEEQSAVSVRVYERTFRKSPRRELTDWEKEWFARRLPAPPASVLVGAAGQGPEVAELVTRGYRVDALEPSPAGARASLAAGAETVLVARYEDLARAVLEGTSGPASGLAARRYDAVLLGWGSLSFVLEARERARLLRACDRLAPRGPILSSFLGLPARRAPSNRAHASGSAAGRIVGRVRGLGPEVLEAAADVHFGSWFGFARSLAREEIDALGRQDGRHAIWENDAGSGYPHVTFEAAPGSTAEPEAGPPGPSGRASVSS
jgi:hypothetical protein